LLRRAGEDLAEGMRLPVSGDDAVAADAWQAFHARVLGFVARRVAVEADAEDIVQKVFLQLHRNLPGLRSSERLGPWLYQAARNAIADHYRAPARRREVASGGAAEIEPLVSARVEPDVDDAVDAAACLRPLIARLAEPDRRAIEKVELEGLSQRDAAAALGQSLTGMKSRVQRARRKLKSALLECCRIALDGRGGVIGCEQRPADGARPCGGAGERGSCR
jgi:RNA polymerase sigma-70 factor, ECF subfamily